MDHEVFHKTDADISTRVRLESVEPGKWRLEVESNECDPNDEDDYESWRSDGFLLPADLSAVLFEVTRALADARDHLVFHALRASTRGKAELPITSGQAVVIARAKGWSVSVKCVDGCDDGPMLTIESSRPLSAEEWTVAMSQLAKAVDWYEDRMGR